MAAQRAKKAVIWPIQAPKRRPQNGHFWPFFRVFYGKHENEFTFLKGDFKSAILSLLKDVQRLLVRYEV